jgi:hypothetical protein
MAVLLMMVLGSPTALGTPRHRPTPTPAPSNPKTRPTRPR